MTDDKQDPSVVAWAYQTPSGVDAVGNYDNWQWRISLKALTDAPLGTVRNVTPLFDPAMPASDLTAMKAELEEAKKALNEIACFTQTDKLLWWQERARAALSKPKPAETRGRE